MLLAVAAQAQQARLTEKKRWRDNARIDDMMPDGAHEFLQRGPRVSMNS